jgi:glycosyltransferase involved in cell wall biosynthesis
MTLAFAVPGSIEQLTGGYLFARRLVDGLRALGRPVVVLELEGRHPDADDVARASAQRCLARLATDSTVVIDGLALPAFADSLAREARRLRLIGFIHHPLSLETGLSTAAARRYARLEAQLWPHLRGLLCPSITTAQVLLAAGIAADRVCVAIPGTDRPASIRDRSPAGRLELLAVGTITPRKGHALLVEALADLRGHDWQLMCIGSLERDAAAAAALRDTIGRYRLHDRVTLAGERPHADLSAAYREADLFVLPSHHEGYGMVYAEALAHGLPIVATTAGAIPDTVPVGASVLVPPGDTAALREALRRVLTDPALRGRLSAGAALAATALPDWPTAVHRWAAALDCLAA